MVKWYQELQEYLQETKEYQVEHFLQEFKLNINNASLQYMKDWIWSAKEVRKNVKIIKGRN